MKKTGAVLVATGLSSRMGEFRPMPPFGNSTIVLHMVAILRRLGVSPLVVMTRYRAGELGEHLSHASARFVRNERLRETQMFNSVELGIKAAAKECGRIMVLPMDVPAIMPDTTRQVLMIDGEIVQTICRRESGYPIMFQSWIAEQLRAYQGRGGLRGAIEDFDGGITNLGIEDEGIYQDMDTKEEYRELIEWNYKRGGGHPIIPLVQVRLKAGDVFFGPGTGQLLDMVHQTGSIQEACCRIGLSYSKNSHMIRKVERQLGILVVEHGTGGMDGGGSSLADKDKKLMDSYARMVAEAWQSMEQIFLKYFRKGISN